MLKPLVPFIVLVVVLAIAVLLPNTPVRLYYIAGVVAGAATVLAYMVTRRVGQMTGLTITLVLIIAAILIAYPWIPVERTYQALLVIGGVMGLAVAGVFALSGK